MDRGERVRTGGDGSQRAEGIKKTHANKQGGRVAYIKATNKSDEQKGVECGRQQWTDSQ